MQHQPTVSGIHYTDPLLAHNNFLGPPSMPNPRHPTSPRPLRALLAMAALGFPAALHGPAHASPLLETVGAPTSTNPFVARSLPSGAASAYFNPAFLCEQGASAETGALVLVQDLRITLLPRPAGTDVAASIYDARLQNPDGSTSRLAQRPLPTSALRHARGSFEPDQTSGFILLGGIVPLIPEALALGVFAVLPTRAFQTQSAHFVDEREQYFSNSLHFERQGDTMDTNVVATAIGARPLPWLRVGVGVVLTTEGQADNEIFVPDASDQAVSQVNTSVVVRTRIRPHAGLSIHPVAPLRLTSTVHAPTSNDVDGSNDLQLWNFEYPDGASSFPQRYTYRTQTTPLRVSLGAAYEKPALPTTMGWAVAATGMWSRWSTYRDRHGQAPQDSWLDTLSGSVGGRLETGPHRLGVDATYEPSPVPNQEGRTNYVDNDRIGASASYGLGWSVGSGSLQAGLQMQVHRLLPRSVDKSASAAHPVVDEFPDAIDGRTGMPIGASSGLQTNNPGYPGYASDGWLYALSATVALRL